MFFCFLTKYKCIILMINSRELNLNESQLHELLSERKLDITKPTSIHSPNRTHKQHISDMCLRPETSKKALVFVLLAS